MTRPFFKLINGQNSSDYTSRIQWNASTCKHLRHIGYTGSMYNILTIKVYLMYVRLHGLNGLGNQLYIV